MPIEPHAYKVWVFILLSFRTLLIHILPWKSVYNIFNFPLADLLHPLIQNNLKCCKYFGFPCTFAPWQYVMRVTVYAALRPLPPYTVVTCFFRKTEARCFPTLLLFQQCALLLTSEWKQCMNVHFYYLSHYTYIFEFYFSFITEGSFLLFLWQIDLIYFWKLSRNKGKLSVRDLLFCGVAISVSTLYLWVWLFADGWSGKGGTLNCRTSGEGISYGGSKRRKSGVELRRCMMEIKNLFLTKQSKLISVFFPWEWGEE